MTRSRVIGLRRFTGLRQGLRVALFMPAMAAALASVGCASESRLRGELNALKGRLARAEAQGARDCAPYALAEGRAHWEFASLALDKGRHSEATYHLSIAAPNANVALRLAAPQRCGGDSEGRALEVDRDGDGISDDPGACGAAAGDSASGATNGCPADHDADGDGVPDGQDQCVDDAEDMDGARDEDGCPDPDNDLDTIPDASDRCPSEPEDRDGFEDEDGCPDVDNDSDAVPDAEDRCPSEYGAVSERGCPRRYDSVRLTASAIRIDTPLIFDAGRATISPASYPLLSTVAEVLQDFPTVTVEIQGHTDSQGSDGTNQRLSQSRANSVRDYLVQQGITPTRLSAHGYGESRPIESNQTAEGRSTNRRVEFVRTDTSREPQ